MIYSIKLVSIKSRTVPWALKATMNGESRYRFFHYKKEAEDDLETWRGEHPIWFERNFYHNFTTIGKYEEATKQAFKEGLD